MNLVLNLLSTDNSGGLGSPVNTTPDNTTNIGLGLLILFLIVAVILFIIFLCLYIELRKKAKMQTNELSPKIKPEETLSEDEQKVISIYRKLGERFGKQAQSDFASVGENMLNLKEEHKSI